MKKGKIKITKVTKEPLDPKNFGELMKPLPRYTLGSPPWSEEELRKAYFRDFVYTREAIKKHPGFPVHYNLCVLQLSLDIFLDSVEDLLKSVQKFRTKSQSENFWMRPARKQCDKMELHVRRGVFASATSAMALVEHSRKTVADFTILEYQKRIVETFANNQDHRFVQFLRHYVVHCRMIEANWQISWSTEGQKCQFLLTKEKLLAWNKWDSLSKAFIEKHPKGIDVEVLFRNYRDRVKEFHKWFRDAITAVSESALSEYREYERTLNRFSVKSQYNILLQQVVIPRQLDPYEYLERYLTKPEIVEVLRLPMRSREQVDKIIEIIDEYGSCDKELRETVYDAFGVKML